MDDGASDTKNGSRMLRDEVTPDDIASVVASWTGAFYVRNLTLSTAELVDVDCDIYRRH